MILYLDTSSLVKLYVDEDGSDQVRELAGRSHAIAASWVGYTEARSAFSRRFREGGIAILEYRQKVSDFENDWQGYLAVDVSPPILRKAGDLAEKHGLRALDAIHLASALALRDDQTRSVVFSSADFRLVQASEAEGMATPSPL